MPLDSDSFIIFKSTETFLIIPVGRIPVNKTCGNKALADKIFKLKINKMNNMQSRSQKINAGSKIKARQDFATIIIV
jgi:hypothetical protein